MAARSSSGLPEVLSPSASATSAPLPHYDLAIQLYSNDFYSPAVNNNGDGTLTVVVGAAMSQNGFQVGGGSFHVGFRLTPPVAGASITSPSSPYPPLPCSVNFPVYYYGSAIYACLKIRCISARADCRR